MDKITQILENVVRCKYFEAGVHIKDPIKNSYQDGLGRTTQTLDHVVVVHILIWDKRKSQINEYSDLIPPPLVISSRIFWRCICRIMGSDWSIRHFRVAATSTSQSRGHSALISSPNAASEEAQINTWIWIHGRSWRRLNHECWWKKSECCSCGMML
jgi:hypothetical protein